MNLKMLVMAGYTKGSGIKRLEKGMELVSSSGLMVQSMKEYGIRIRQMVKEE